MRNEEIYAKRVPDVKAFSPLFMEPAVRIPISRGRMGAEPGRLDAPAMGPGNFVKSFIRSGKAAYNGLIMVKPSDRRRPALPFWARWFVGGGGVVLLALLFAAFLVTGGSPAPEPSRLRRWGGDEGGQDGGGARHPVSMPAPPVASGAPSPVSPSGNGGNPVRGTADPTGELLGAILERLCMTEGTPNERQTDILALAAHLRERPVDVVETLRRFAAEDPPPAGGIRAMREACRDSAVLGASAAAAVSAIADPPGGTSDPGVIRRLSALLMPGLIADDAPGFSLGPDTRDLLHRALAAGALPPRDGADFLFLILARGSGADGAGDPRLPEAVTRRLALPEPPSAELTAALADLEGRGVRTGIEDCLADSAAPAATRSAMLASLGDVSRRSEELRDRLGIILRPLVENAENAAPLRAAALRIMGTAATGPEAEDLADRMLRDPAGEVRLAAAEMLGDRSELPDAARQALREAAGGTGEGKLREAAIRALGRSGTAEDAEALRTLTTADDAAIREAAGQAIRQIQIRRQ